MPAPKRPARSVHARALRLGAAVFVGYCAMALAMLVQSGGRLDSFVRFGSQDRTIVVAHEKLGDDVVPTSGEGFDGQYFWLQAHDPLLLDRSLYERGSAEPAYRTPRMLYPLVVAPGLLLGETGLMAWMLLFNLLVAGVGTYVVGRLCVELGGPIQGGLVFALNPGIITGAFQDVSDPLALLCVVTVLWAIRHQWLVLACAAAAGAVATKEFTFLAVAGVALLGSDVPRRTRIGLLASAAGAGGLVALYVRSRFGSNTSSQNLERSPFRGFVDSWNLDWSINGNWFDALTSCGLVVAGAWAIARWWRRRTPELAACVLIALATPFLAGVVVRYFLNVSRVVAPLVAGLSLDVVVARAKARRAT